MKNEIARAISKVDLTPQYHVEVLGKKIAVPLVYADASAVMLFFTANANAVNKLLPNKLSSIKVWPGKSLFAVNFFNYRDSPAGPYTEFTFSLPVQINARLKVPVLPILFDNFFSNVGYFVTMMGADTDLGIKHIEQIIPYPLAPGKITTLVSENSGIIRCSIAEDGNEIITADLKVPKGLSLSQKSYNTLYAHDNKLFNVKLKVTAYSGMLFRGFSSIIFREHKIAGIFKELNVSDKPVFAVYYKQATEIASAPQILWNL